MRLFLLVFFLLTGENRGVSLREIYVYPSKPIKAHHFAYVYNHIRQNIEGNYVHHPKDKGGETYAGIARRFHPDWQGWWEIDAAKPLQRHDSVPSAEYFAKDFYLTIWVTEGFEVIEDQSLALNLFDFRIHSSPRTVELFTNRVLTQMGCEPITIGDDWVDNRFNQVDPTEFALRLKIQRILLFNHIVTRHPDQRVFYNGWKRRIMNI